MTLNLVVLMTNPEQFNLILTRFEWGLGFGFP